MKVAKQLIMKEIKQLLNEILTDILYHFSGIDRIENILKTNKFLTTAAFATQSEVEQNKGKFYFLSTARSTFGKYSDSMESGFGYVVLDGRKLGHTFSGTAVDYWGETFRKANKGKHEEEDRIFTNKPFIENARKYILEIHLCFGKGVREKNKFGFRNYNDPVTKFEWDITDNFYSIKNIFNLFPKVFVYKDPRAWKLKNRKKAFSSEESFVHDVKKQQQVPEKTAPYQSRYRPGEQLEYFLELFNFAYSGTGELSKKAKDLLDNMKYYPKDKFISIKNDIHNIKGNIKVRSLINKIVLAMNKIKTTSISELYGYVYDHYKEEIVWSWSRLIDSKRR